jgi:RNA recognition motif-containing protein
MRTLYVGGLPKSTDATTLRMLFSPYGGIEDARIVCKTKTGLSRGFGYVTFESELAAYRAKEALNGSVVEGKMLRVDVAR